MLHVNNSDMRVFDLNTGKTCLAILEYSIGGKLLNFGKNRFSYVSRLTKFYTKRLGLITFRHLGIFHFKGGKGIKSLQFQKIQIFKHNSALNYNSVRKLLMTS